MEKGLSNKGLKLLLGVLIVMLIPFALALAYSVMTSNINFEIFEEPYTIYSGSSENVSRSCDSLIYTSFASSINLSDKYPGDEELVCIKINSTATKQYVTSLNFEGIDWNMVNITNYEARPYIGSSNPNNYLNFTYQVLQNGTFSGSINIVREGVWGA